MTKAEHRISQLKGSSEKSSPEAHSALLADPVKNEFVGDVVREQEFEQEADGTLIPPNEAHPPSQAVGDSSELPFDPESAPEETGKKWGLSSLLSRGRSDSIPSKLETDSASATLTTTTKGSWFNKGRSRHSSRASSADTAPSNIRMTEASYKHSNTPIVGGLPLVEVLLPETDETTPEAPDVDGSGRLSTQENGGSPQRGISVSAPVSRNVTPVVDPLLPLAIGSTHKKGTHRRHRSLLETLGWSKGSRSTASTTSNSGDLDTLDDNTNGNRSNGNNGSLVAAGLNGGDSSNITVSGVNKRSLSGSLTDIEQLEVELPPSVPFATRGMSNMGNSCFLNAAVQCLRHTPGLPLVLIPNLHEKATQRAQEQLEAQTQASPETEATKCKEEEQEALNVAKQDESAPKETVAALANLSGESKAATEVVPPRASTADGEEDAADETVLSNDSKNEETTGVVAANTAEKGAVAEQQGHEDTPLTQPPPAAVPVAPSGPLPRPSQGELASSVAALFAELYLNPVTPSSSSSSSAVSPSTLLSVLRRFPTAADYFDGRQQDCQEVLQILLDLLHDDLNRVQPKKKKKEEEEEDDDDQEEKNVEENEQEQQKTDCGSLKDTVQAVRSTSTGLPPRPPTPSNSPSVASLALPPQLQPTMPLIKSNSSDESMKADNAWSSWRRTADSPIADLFKGQLQSSVTCSKCGGRFTMYEPFWELSLPLAPSSGGAFSWLTFKGGSSLSLQDCLRAYTASEKLDGKEAFSCEKCREKTAATKHLRLHRLPDALVLHLKRFKHGGAGRGGDKLATDVVFPLRSLDLSNHLSPESPHSSQECLYDLYAISYHTGSLAGGHYLACCRLSQGGTEGPTTKDASSWYFFNDETVTPVADGNVKTQNAYILFYARRKFKDSNAAAAAFALRDAAKQSGSSSDNVTGHRHRRSASSGGSGSGGGGFLFRNKE
jgi:ubiquitin C-terminal hydrolase